MRTAAIFLFSYAQISVTGVVKSSVDETPIPFVTIQATNGSATTSDENGKYTISVSENDQLRFSAIGYTTQTVSVENRTTINIVLAESTTSLDEVVVTALGVKRESKELGYTVQSLEAEEISEVKAVNFLDNLAGKLAGVSITPGPTGVGSSSKITIRGEASFSNNNPLFVVDGTPINNTTVFNNTNEAAAGFQEIDFGNGAMEVNPDDIESVTVLKGPTAAALYGTRAANGVIVIETKDGSKAKGMGISINTTLFVDKAFKLPKFQNEYGQGNSGQFEYVDGLGGGTNDLISYSWGPRLDVGNLIPQYDSPVYLEDGSVVRGGDTALYDGLPITPTPFVSQPNNLKDFYKTGITTINNVSVSDNFGSGNYRLSFTDLRSESIIPGVNLDRQTVATNLTFRPSKKTEIATSISYVNSSSDNRPSNGYGSENVNYALVAWGPRSLNIENMKQYWQPGLENVQHFSFNYTYFDNPYFTLLENRNSFDRDRVFGNIAIKQNFTKHFSISLRTGMDYSSENREFRRAYSSNRFKNGAYAEHDVLYRELNTDFLINYNNLFGNFSLDLSAGGNRLDQKASTKESQALNLAQPGVFSLNNAASPLEIYQFESEKRINSVYGFAKFGFKNFLFLDMTGRNDWSSALATPFSVDGTSFFYPSASLSFILSNAIALPNVISFAKFRGSVAQVGNDTSPYQTTGAFVSQTPYLGQPTFSDQNFISNANLKPEQVTSYEVGADIRFFKDRLNFDFTYFNALTEDQIISLPIAISSGYSQQVVNGGKVRAQGIELVANIIPIKNTNFQWNNSFTYKNFNLSFLFDWRQGGELVSRTHALATVGGQLEETGGDRGDIIPEGVVNIGTEENPNYVPNTTAVSAETYYRQFYDRNHEENNTYDASYLKLRQFAIGYTFDTKKGFAGLSEGAKINFSIIGRNIFAISDIPHFDPEQFAVQGTGFVSGVEDMSYASTRSIGFKAGLTF